MIEAYYLKARTRETLGDRRGALAELRQLFGAAEVTDRGDSGRQETLSDALDLLRRLQGAGG